MLFTILGSQNLSKSLSKILLKEVLCNFFYFDSLKKSSSFARMIIKKLKKFLNDSIDLNNYLKNKGKNHWLKNDQFK